MNDAVMETFQAVAETLAETVPATEPVIMDGRYFMTVPFDNYTVTEGLLLLIFVLLLVKFVFDLIWRL